MPFEKNDIRINRDGRPQGSQNRTPDRKKAVELLNRILDSLTDSFNELTRDEQIKLLHVFKHLFETNVTITESQSPSEIKVTIVKNLDHE
tara:strand:+ start:4422 stop:4691 length:270 start_codon:yes stop_codon:yes gene_type:complete